MVEAELWSVRRVKRPEQHEIDEAAQRIFRAALPLGWVLKEQKPDYAIDYVVEVGVSDI